MYLKPTVEIGDFKKDSGNSLNFFTRGAHFFFLVGVRTPNRRQFSVYAKINIQNVKNNLKVFAN